jgi:hypothetical protein
MVKSEYSKVESLGKVTLSAMGPDARESSFTHLRPCPKGKRGSSYLATNHYTGGRRNGSTCQVHETPIGECPGSTDLVVDKDALGRVDDRPKDIGR